MSNSKDLPFSLRSIGSSGAVVASLDRGTLNSLCKEASSLLEIKSSSDTLLDDGLVAACARNFSLAADRMSSSSTVWSDNNSDTVSHESNNLPRYMKYHIS